MRGSIHTCGKWIHPRAYLTIPLWVISLEYSVYLTTPLSRLWLKTQTYLAAPLNIWYIWPHHCQTFDLSFRWIHLTTLLASLWRESQTLLYRAFVKSLTRISDIFDDTFDKGTKANQITPLTRVKGEGKRRQRQVFVGRQRCTKVCKGGLYRAFDFAFEAR